MQDHTHEMPQHLNGCIFAAVDVETTGPDPYMHSIVEIAIVPLNADFTISKKYPIFDMLMQPLPDKLVDPEAMRKNHIDLVDLHLNHLDAYKVLDLMVVWFKKLNLPIGKTLVPIAQNYVFDYGFLRQWMGTLSYDEMFSWFYRDTMSLACSMNDIADQRAEKCPYNKYNLNYLAAEFGIKNPAPHRALGDAVTTAEIYRQMLKRSRL